MTEINLEPKPLSYYHSFVDGCCCTLTLNKDEAATILKAYDHGVEVLDQQERVYLGKVLYKLKTEIWP